MSDRIPIRDSQPQSQYCPKTAKIKGETFGCIFTPGHPDNHDFSRPITEPLENDPVVLPPINDPLPSRASAPASQMPPLQNLMDKAVCLVITRGLIGVTRSVNVSKVTVDADKSMVTVAKKLFESQELKQIISIDGKIDAYIRSRCLPSFFKKSVHLLPIDLLQEVDQRLTEHVNERRALIDAFCAVYDETILKAQTSLRDLFNSADYETVSNVRAAFKYSWQYVEFGTSSSLKEISKSMFEREQAKMQEQWTEAFGAAKQVLRAAMAEMVDHMVDRLSPSPDGKKKVFHKSMLAKFNDFLETFQSRNLTDDSDLQALVSRAKELTKGVTADTLRSNEGLKSSVQGGFAEIKKQLDGMLVDAPRRRIILD